MNNSRKTFALAQMFVRHFSQTATRRSAQAEITSNKFGALKQEQKVLGADDHQLVHVKAGFKDKAMYQVTAVLTAVGVIMSGDVLVRLFFK
ncbi:hypothetical protein Trydic_g4487 [Trypoxylus dichotomus]